MTPIPPDIIETSLRIVESLNSSGCPTTGEDLYDNAAWILNRHLEMARKVIEEAEKKR